MTTTGGSYRVDWYRVPLPPGRLAELNARSDARGLLQALGHLALLAATAAAAIRAVETRHWWWLLPILFAHGTVASFMINAVHELVHGTVFRTRWLNTGFVHVFAFVGWINHHAFWASHSEHHLYTLHDPQDQEVVLPIRYRWSHYARIALVDPMAIRWVVRGTWRTAIGRLDDGWQRELLEGQPAHFRVRRWAWCLLLGHGAIAVVSIACGWWIVPVLVSLTPCYTKGLFFLLNSTQHVGLQDHVDDFRLNCRSIDVNPAFRFLYWHMNYHIEHHMYAAVPCYRLRALNREIAHALPTPPRGLVGAWFHILGVLYRQQQDPGYQYRPQLPEDDAGEGPHPPEPEHAAQRPRVAATAATVPIGPAPASGPSRVWQCSICGFVYDEAQGLPEEGIAPGTPWAAIPEDWSCPDCGVAKADFVMVEQPRAVAAPMPVPEPIVIVGSGMAGYALARAYRRLDPTRRLVVLSRDGGEAYAKPLLSTALAQGQTPEALVRSTAAAIATELDLELRRGVVVEAIDRDRRELQTSVGTIAYGELVLALGAEPIRLPVAGDAARQILSVNDLDDYRVFRQRLEPGARVLIIGAGLIGCEFANDLAAAGHPVRVVDRAEAPLANLVPPAIAAQLRRALAAQGVEWRLGTSLAALDAAGDGFVARLADGSGLTVDLVLSAVGLRPRIALAQAAGLAVGRGIRTDGSLQTSDPAIWALGDCAEVDGVVRPFVRPLMQAAQVLAATLAGRPSRLVPECWPIVVKTPSCPLVIAPPPPGSSGEWVVEPAGEARFVDPAGRVCGFALAGDRCDRQTALLAALGRVRPQSVRDGELVGVREDR